MIFIQKKKYGIAEDTRYKSLFLSFNEIFISYI